MWNLSIYETNNKMHLLSCDKIEIVTSFGYNYYYFTPTIAETDILCEVKLLSNQILCNLQLDIILLYRFNW